jgi:hypothetical protein
MITFNKEVQAEDRFFGGKKSITSFDKEGPPAPCNKPLIPHNQIITRILPCKKVRNKLKQETEQSD